MHFKKSSTDDSRRAKIVARLATGERRLPTVQDNVVVVAQPDRSSKNSRRMKNCFNNRRRQTPTPTTHQDNKPELWDTNQFQNNLWYDLSFLSGD